MSEANNIKNYSAEDIRRYWKNEMSAQEMHALEIAAMEDPFLADALEGYSKLQKDPSNDLALLKTRIAERAATAAVVKMKRRNQWLRVAAIFILLAGMGVVAFKMMQQNKNDLAKNESPKANAAPVPKEKATSTQPTDQYLAKDSSRVIYDSAEIVRPSDLATAPSKRELKNFKPVAKPEAISSGIAKAEGNDDKDSFALKEVVANRQAEYKKSAAPVAAQKSESLDRFESRAKLDTTAINAGAAPEQGRKQDAEHVFLYNTFSGKVVDLQNRSIPSAQVRMNNANQLASTDQYGMFQFKSRDSVADITIASPGYQEKNLTLNSNQSGLITMERQPSKSKFSEVVVSGMGAKKKSAQAPDLHVYVMDAEPLIGWDKYNRYLDSNKKIPADEPRLQGEVVLSFKVSSKGELSSFDVEQSLSKSYDKEAIRLIKEGPGWRVTNGKKTRVKVIVRF